MAAGEIVPHPNADVVASSEVPSLMDAIPAQWQAKGLIERVRRLLPVDPSSACQRLFNAAVADLREKVKIAGIDIAKEAAASFKLPPIDRADDIDNYSTAKPRSTGQLGVFRGVSTRKVPSELGRWECLTLPLPSSKGHPSSAIVA
jgi:hypothetical protein